MTITELEHSIDVGFRVTSSGLDRLFEDAALALMENIVDTHQILRKDSLEIELAAATRSDLMYSWLSELIKHFDNERFLIGEVVATVAHITDDGWRLNATVSGETLDHRRHQIRAHVKVITKAQLKLIEDADDGNEWLAEVYMNSNSPLPV